MTEPAVPLELRTKLEGQFGIRWTPQREREAQDLEGRGPAGVDVTDTLNGETHFFRFPFYLDVLRSHFEKRQDGSSPYRVHCAACSTGEEAYSVAFSLVGAGGPFPQDLQISGSDARLSAIEIARQALYGKWSLRGVSSSNESALLVAEGKLHRVREPYRSQVQFAVKNLLDPYEQTYDAIFLCNVTLYMTEEAAQRSYRLAGAALRPNGLLFVAPTDPVPVIPELRRHLVYKGWPIFGRADGTPSPKDCHDKGSDVPGKTSSPKMSGKVRTRNEPATAPPPARPSPVPMAELEESAAVLHAWANGDLPRVETTLRRLVFLDPEHALWRFLTGCLQWEQGWLRRARKELDRASLLAAALPEDQNIEGVGTAGDLRRMIDAWNREAT